MPSDQFDVSEYFSNLKRVIDALPLRDVNAAIEVIAAAWKQGKQIIALGNGGSALTALHYITDWNKAVYLVLRPLNK